MLASNLFDGQTSLDLAQALFGILQAFAQVIINGPKQLRVALDLAGELFVALASLDSRRRRRVGNDLESVCRVHSSSVARRTDNSVSVQVDRIYSLRELFILPAPLRFNFAVPARPDT